METIRNIMKDHNDPHYLDIAKKVEQGILSNGIVKKDGNQKIVHGWGDNRSFYVGSFDDIDHVSRYSSTSHSFFVLSGLLNNNPQYHKDILIAAKALDSKYGIRIVNLPKGTAENGATYIHSGMFFARALFSMKEGKAAFEQISKLIPITHQKVSTSPFVMPNSYGYNLELGIDGESMSDWYTGSSNTLLKAIVFDMFGIKPQIGEDIIIDPTDYFPSDDAKISLIIKGKKVNIRYQNKHGNKRKIYVNDILLDNQRINLKSYKGKINIDIID